MRFQRIAILVLFGSWLGACSNTFVYNQLDWLIPWYVDDYVDLDRDQKKRFKAQVRSLLQWHRAEELQFYIDILDRIEADLQRQVTATDVESWANLTVAAYDRIESRMLPVLFDVGRDLTDAQMQQFIDKLMDGQSELEEEYLPRDEAEYASEVQEQFVDNLDDFLGRLTDEQLALIETASLSLRRFDAAWLEERARWLATLADLLEREPGWEEAVMKALDERDRDRTDAYREAYAHNGRIINGTIAEVLNLRTEKQAARLQRELDDLRRDLRKLIEQGKD